MVYIQDNIRLIILPRNKIVFWKENKKGIEIQLRNQDKVQNNLE